MQKSPEELYDLICQLMEKIDGLGTRLERYEKGIKPEEIDLFAEKIKKLVRDFEHVQGSLDRDGMRLELTALSGRVGDIEKRLRDVGELFYDFG